jgi:hypothetical protein
MAPLPKQPGLSIYQPINIDCNNNRAIQILQGIYSRIAKREIITYRQGGFRATNSFVALKKTKLKCIQVFQNRDLLKICGAFVIVL